MSAYFSPGRYLWQPKPPQASARPTQQSPQAHLSIIRSTRFSPPAVKSKRSPTVKAVKFTARPAQVVPQPNNLPGACLVRAVLPKSLPGRLQDPPDLAFQNRRDKNPTCLTPLYTHSLKSGIVQRHQQRSAIRSNSKAAPLGRFIQFARPFLKKERVGPH
jgi:hypothetical protein